MIVVDTNVWVDFFNGRFQVQSLQGLLLEEEVLTHPFVLAELSLGNFGTQRDSQLQDLRRVPSLALEFDFEFLNDFVEEYHLFASGLSFIDAELLKVCHERRHLLWTQDKTLNKAACRMHLQYSPRSA